MMQLCSYALPIVESMGPNKSHHSNISETQSGIPQLNCNAVCTCTNRPASALSHTSKHIYTTRTTYHYMQELSYRPRTGAVAVELCISDNS